ncbi:MAG: hypothetical protein OFPII_08520 [Osedax symbiont Rs1]|nr:MAG: hypothetical protein OFPII_08520 [Osedax symbiont Rs1]
MWCSEVTDSGLNKKTHKMHRHNDRLLKTAYTLPLTDHRLF